MLGSQLAATLISLLAKDGTPRGHKSAACPLTERGFQKS